MEIAIPLLLLAGFVVFKLRDHSSFESVGCALIGLGLMLLALHLLGGTLQDIEVTPVFHAVMQGLQGDIFIALLVAALLTLLCHSSVAMILLIASSPGTGTLTPSTALVLVLGANIGGALPPVLNAGSAVARRLPVGNLMVRLSGCALALLLPPLLMAIARKSGLNTPQLVVWFHTAFSVALALLFIGLNVPMARFLERLFPEEERVGDPGMPMYLDDAGLEVAYIGLSNPVRESLRAADMLTIMLDRLLVLFVTQEKQAADDIRQLEQVGPICSARRFAPTSPHIGQDGLNDADADRAQEILMFIINVEHAGDILSSNLTQLATRRARRGEQFNDFELHHIRLLHAELLTSLNLGIAAFLREDLSAAHQLVQRKETIRQLEASASREHFKKLREDKNAWRNPATFSSGCYGTTAACITISPPSPTRSLTAWAIPRCGLLKRRRMFKKQ